MVVVCADMGATVAQVEYKAFFVYSVYNVLHARTIAPTVMTPATTATLATMGRSFAASSTRVVALLNRSPTDEAMVTLTNYGGGEYAGNRWRKLSNGSNTKL